MTTETLPVFEGELEPTAKGVYLTLGGESFRCRNTSVSWHMMEFGAAQQKAARANPVHKDNDEGKPCKCPACEEASKARAEAGMDMMAAMRKLILAVIVKSERDRFLKFMDEAELDNGELEEAIGNVIAELGKQAEGPKAGDGHKHS